MGNAYFECDYCGQGFVTHQKRTAHQKQCMSDMFSDEFLLPIVEPERHEPTYREMIEKAAERDPFYRRYAERVNIAEPNGMTLIIKEIQQKERDARRRAKEEAQGVCNRPEASK